MAPEVEPEVVERKQGGNVGEPDVPFRRGRGAGEVTSGAVPRRSLAEKTRIGAVYYHPWRLG